MAINSNAYPEMTGFIVIPIQGKSGTSLTTFASNTAALANAIETLIAADEALNGSSTVKAQLGSNYVRGKVEYRAYPTSGSPADKVAS